MISAIALPENRAAAQLPSDLPHVLLILDQMGETLGGGERIVLRLAEHLPSYGYRASILTFAASPDGPALQSPPCTIYLLPLTRVYGFTAARGAWELRKFIRSHKVDLVATFFESSDLWGGLVAKTAGAKVIWSRRDMGILRQKKHQIAYRWMASMPDAVIAVSEQVRMHSIDVDGIDADRVFTVHNGLDIARWSAPDRPSKNAGDAMLVTTVGNIRRVKGHDVFVRAAAVLAGRFPRARFSVAGKILEQDYFSELTDLVQSLGLQDRFYFDGAVSDPRGHLAAADIFVLPSRSEGFSNAIVEAMAASLPVVATNVGGNAEAVDDGTTGFIVPPEDETLLADALAKLLAEPLKAQAMGQAGRIAAMEKFTVAAMMDKVAAIYRQVLRQD